MTDRLSEGPIQVFDTSIVGLNDAFRQVQNRLDHLKGLRGRAELFDRVQVSDPVVSGDAVNLSTRDAEGLVSQTSGFMFYGTTKITYTDSNGTVLHGFGNV